MSNNDSIAGGLAIGCGLVAVLLLGMGFLFFGRATAIGPISGAPLVEFGYTLGGGDWRALGGNVFEGTVYVRPSADWTMREFEFKGATLRIDGADTPMTLTSPAPKLPTDKEFELRFEVELPPNAEGQAQTGDGGRVILDLRTYAKTGLFGRDSKTDGSRGLAISGERLIVPPR